MKLNKILLFTAFLIYITSAANSFLKNTHEKVGYFRFTQVRDPSETKQQSPDGKSLDSSANDAKISENKKSKDTLANELSSDKSKELPKEKQSLSIQEQNVLAAKDKSKQDVVTTSNQASNKGWQTPAIVNVKTELQQSENIQSPTTNPVKKIPITESNPQDKIGKTGNQGDEEVLAVKNGLASTKSLPKLPTKQILKSPITVKSLYYDDGNTGPQQEAQEVKTSDNVYYDPYNQVLGDSAFCKDLTNPLECVGQKVCGWCGAQKVCVPGTPKGPKKSCVGLYTFKQYEGWNPYKEYVPEQPKQQIEKKEDNLEQFSTSSN